MAEIVGQTCTIYSAHDGVIIEGRNTIVAHIGDEWFENLECLGEDGQSRYYTTSDRRIIVYNSNDYVPNQINVYDSWDKMVEQLEWEQWQMATDGDPESDAKPCKDVLDWLDDLRHRRFGEWVYNKFSCKYEYVKAKKEADV